MRNPLRRRRSLRPTIIKAAPKVEAPILATTLPAAPMPTPRQAAPRRPRVFSQPAPDAVDPFAERFEEEELVLESFATLASIFGTRTPRVENSREPAISRLVQHALEASSAAASEQASPSEPELEDARDFERELRRGMIRLAVVNDAPAVVDEPVIAAVGESRHSASLEGQEIAAEDTCDDTILVIEDDPAPPTDPQPGVRRESYRQLFSRLRHGT